MKIYGIKNCNSMKKAFDVLAQANIAYEFHDYKKLGIDAETLKTWIAQLGAETVLNKKGTTWKKLTEQQQQYALESEQNLIEMLMANTSMIKRPILDTSEKLIAGFDEQVYQQLG